MRSSPSSLLGVEQRHPGERSEADPARFGAHEGRRHDDPPVEHHGVDAEVVAVDLPSPRLARLRRAEDRHEVRPFAERLVVAGELGEQLVDAHDRTCVVVPARRQWWPARCRAPGRATGWARSSSMTPWRKWFMWTLIHIRHSAASIGNIARWRCSGVSACRKASAASAIGRVSTLRPPSERSPVRAVPSVVTPRNGRSSSAARSSTMSRITARRPRRRVASRHRCAAVGCRTPATGRSPAPRRCRSAC